ncbi:MAG: hypothetical protein AAF602_09245, partial [Myxococcota bacterium]
MVDPARWDVIDGRLLPVLSRLVLRNGANRVSVRKDGSADVSLWLAHEGQRPASVRRYILDPA